MSHGLISRLDVRFFEGALCAQSDPDAFFPERGDASIHANKAKAICFFCPNSKECLDYALLIDDRWAIMGGLTPRARRKIRKGHKQSVKQGLIKGLTPQQIADENDFTLIYVKRLITERANPLGIHNGLVA